MDNISVHDHPLHENFSSNTIKGDIDTANASDPEQHRKHLQESHNSDDGASFYILLFPVCLLSYLYRTYLLVYRSTHFLFHDCVGLDTFWKRVRKSIGRRRYVYTG